MDLDINVKSVRYSVAGKLLCLALGFITMLSCVSVGLNTFAAYNYYVENRGKWESFTDSYEFKDAFTRDLGIVLSNFQSYEDSNGNEDGYYFETLYCKSLNIYADKDGHNSSDTVCDSYYNELSFSADEAKSHDFYLVYEDGKVSSKGFSNDFLTYVKEFNWYKEFDNLYIYLDFSAYDDANVAGKLQFFDKYVAIRDNFDTAMKYYNGINFYVVLTVILLILTIAFGICYLTVTGKKNSEDKAKLAFIDYVPFGLHLAVSVGLGFCAGVLMSWALDYFEYISNYAVAIVCLFAAVVWLLLTELISSVVRSIKSDRKLYKFFLIYWIIYPWLRLKSGIKKSSRRIIQILSYRPKAVRRNVIILLIGYLFINIILLLFVATGIEFALEGELIPLLIVIPLFIAFNIAAIILSMKYIKKLDVVVDHMIAHKDYEGDIQSLPPMLRELVKSMQFTNEELRNAVAKAVKDERLRTELITNVSHDLKTPLTSIINYVDLLSHCNIEDEKAKSYIGVLEDKGAKLKRLIDDLIEASKVTSGNVTVNLAPINLSELCLQATVEAQDEFEKAGLSLVVKPQDTSHIVIADGSKTYRIIENLLSNARKYSAKSSRVYVDVYDENGFGIFEIKNVSAQPLDISADELTERFVRGDKSRKQEGNGLGLSIAKELARLQNGNLVITIDGDLFKARVKLPSNSK